MEHTINRVTFGGFLLLLVVSMVIAGCNPTPTVQPSIAKTNIPTEESKEIVLTMGAWRTSTEGMNRVLNKFHEENPHITIRWDPTLSGEYDAVLQGQLDLKPGCYRRTGRRRR